MDNSNFRSFSMRPQKLKNNPTYPSALGCANQKIPPDLPRRPVDIFWQRMEIFFNIFHKKSVVRTGKKGSAIFYSRPRMEVEVTVENGRNISNTGSENSIWVLVRIIHGTASETQMLSVEVMWVMPSVTGWLTLSTPIRKAEPNISDGGTSPNTFAASFNERRTREKKLDSAKCWLKNFND